jgi:sigma-B regulation protein RsbU (phosphoserine phosphatase)
MTRPDAVEQRRAIDEVTRAAGGLADADELLGRLLARVVELLGADTAAVLLLDDAGQHLVARAAHHIEGEIQRGVRARLDQGFAGRIAAERRPVMSEAVDEAGAGSPVLWERGVRAMLGVPLEGGGRVMGVLHVGRLAARPFSTEDTELLQLVAERVVAALQVQELEAQRTAALVVQRSLLPSALPACEGIEFASRYVPAERPVGGDWYDAFRLDSGDLWAVTGDVAGHGLGAAIIMGRIRSTLRAYALEGHDPAEVLALTDRKLQFFEPGQTATVVCARLRPPYDAVEVSSAGHPPPVLATPAGGAALVEVPTTPPLGVVDRLRPGTELVKLPVGALFLSYTDGLVERRVESIDVGLQRLLDTVEPREPEAVCRLLMDELVGTAATLDDIAVLALRRVATADGPAGVTSRPARRRPS